jgi:hypothetical protein
MSNKLITAVVCLMAGFVVTMGVIAVSTKTTDNESVSLIPYTGIGSGVYKHGTIVKIEDGKPVVIGHFDDETGATYPGTWELKND